MARVPTSRCAEIVRTREEPLFAVDLEESVALAAELICLRELLALVVARYERHGGQAAGFAQLMEHIAKAVHESDEAGDWIVEVELDR